MVGFGDIAGMMGQFKNIQANMQQMQEELANKSVEASSGGGMVTAKVNGKGELLDIKIDAQVANGDVEMLEDLVVAAVTAAIAKSREIMQQEMSKVTGGLNIPGLDQFLK